MKTFRSALLVSVLFAAPALAQQQGTGQSSPQLDVANPWTTYTPTVAAGSGTFTTASATGTYSIKGSILFYSITVTITTNGSAANNVTASLPKPCVGGAFTAMGRETASTGNAFQGVVLNGQSVVTMNSLTNGYPGGTGYSLNISGFYQIANPLGGP